MRPKKCIMRMHGVCQGQRSRGSDCLILLLGTKVFEAWLYRLLAHTVARLLWIGLVAGICVAQSKDDRALTGPKSALGQVSGHVYRADTGEPIPKTQVSLLPADEATTKAAEPRTVRSGPDGAFTFTDIPGGNYQIEASHNSYSEYDGSLDFEPANLERTNRRIALKPGQTVQSISLHLYPAGVISGQLLDEDQDPIAGLPVLALRIDFTKGGQRSFLVAGQTVTDDLGNYRMPDVPPGSYLVRAGGLMQRPMREVSLKEGPAGRVQYQNTFYPGTSTLSEAQAVHVGPLAESRDTRFVVLAERTFTMRGKVTGGAPANGSVEVDCTSPDDIGYNFTNGRSAAADPDGSFKIPGLPPGDYTLTATSTNQGIQSDLGFASIHVADADVHADVEIGHAAEVYGKVEAPADVSLQGKKIELAIFGPGFYLLHQSEALDRTGRFHIKTIPPGVFTFSLATPASDQSFYVKKASCNGSDYAAREFTLTAESRLDCDVMLAHDTSTVHGKVTSSDKPIAGAVVVMIPSSAELRKVPRYTLTARTDAAGQYKLAAVIPSDYVLFAVPSSSDHAYFDPAFVARNTLNSESVTIDPGRAETVDLKLSGSQ